MTSTQHESHTARTQRHFGMVLGRETAPDEDFFELGGDSFRAVMVAVGLGEELGVELDPDVVFDHRTARALGAHLDEQDKLREEPDGTGSR